MARVIIIGSGPAGIFTALTLIEGGLCDIIILERGDDIDERKSRKGHKNLVSGWGGAGAFSDGKLTLSPEVGGFLSDFMPLDRLEKLIEKADGIWVSYGAPSEVYGGRTPATARLKEDAKRLNMTFVTMSVRHIGTENAPDILTRMREHIGRHAEVRCNTPVAQILAEGGKAAGVVTESGEEIRADYVVATPGRSGAKWMQSEVKRLGLSSVPSPVDIGVRVEVPAVVTAELTEAAYESKIIYYTPTFDDKARTFCMNPHGEVVTEKANDDLVTVNGHSYADRPTENTNFAILVSTTFTEPFDDPLGYGHHISQLANFLGKGVIIQRLGDLYAGRRSTPARIARSVVPPTLKTATPGDLSFVLPYRHLVNIVEMLEALDNLAPGINSPHTLLYGVEVKFYSHRLKLSKKLESELENLFMAGDGAGITRGLIQASVSGIIAGSEILSRIQD